MKLLVYVPALLTKRDGRAGSAELRRRLAADLGDGWQVRTFEHGIRPWSTERMADAAHRLAVQVRTWAGDNGAGEPVDEVLLVGHSLGGLLVRHAYLLDAGATGDPARGTYPWTGKVRRIVLLAAPNAGFRPERLPLWQRAGFSALAAVRQFTMEDLQAGSPYLTELRLRWVDAFRGATGRPVVVQVLGDRDDIVARDDSLDVEFMPNATRVDVPGATHGSVVLVGTEPDDERYAVLRHAILGELPAARLGEVPPTGRPVYFLLHGIRAGRYANWVGELAARLAADAPDAVVHTPSYGYLSAAEFAIPFTRSRNLRNFLDWYGRLYVTHGPGDLHFAGHSNGTYLLGRALRDVPALRFDRVYLAGTVLPREYPWSTIETRGQVGTVHSDRATGDVPVGWLCAALRGLGMKDVGTGGVTGFDQATAALVEHDRAFPGGHGAALAGERRIAEVAEFLRTGKPGHEPEPDGAPSGAFAFAGRLAGVVALPVAAGGVIGAALWVAGAADAGQRLQRLATLAGGGFAVVAAGRAV